MLGQAPFLDAHDLDPGRQEASVPSQRVARRIQRHHYRARCPARPRACRPRRSARPSARRSGRGDGERPGARARRGPRPRTASITGSSRAWSITKLGMTISCATAFPSPCRSCGQAAVVKATIVDQDDHRGAVARAEARPRPFRRPRGRFARAGAEAAKSAPTTRASAVAAPSPARPSRVEVQGGAEPGAPKRTTAVSARRTRPGVPATATGPIAPRS